MKEAALGFSTVIRRLPHVMDDYFKPALIMTTVIIGVLLFLRLPLFFISDIEIIGTTRLTGEYIKQVMDIHDGETCFFWNAPVARGQLLKNNYVDRVDIDINYMSRRVTIRIRERILSGYVEYTDGIYLYIDERGRVLESATRFTERLPVVVGLEFSEFTIGEILKVNNPVSFDLVVILAQLFNRYQISSDIIKVDVSKPEDIHLYIRNIDVEFGDISGAEEKIRMIQAIMDEYLNNTDESGFLNIRDINRPPKYRPLQ